MEKIKSLRASAALAVAVLLTTCLIGGTFAKYTTAASGNDSVRVAYWGFDQTNTLNLSGLFSSMYTNVKSSNGQDVMAPGTEGSASFSFAFDESHADAPEVNYTFNVTVTENCDASIRNNPAIRFKLDAGTFGTWEDLVADIKALSGDPTGTKAYAAGTLPTAFPKTDEVHTISWKWDFQDGTAAQDTMDTTMGTAASLASLNLAVSITATQID